MTPPRIHLRADEANGQHTRFTVFCNGANCGQLCMRESEAIYFHDALMFSRYPKAGDIITSGEWMNITEEK